MTIIIHSIFQANGFYENDIPFMFFSGVHILAQLSVEYKIGKACARAQLEI